MEKLVVTSSKECLIGDIIVIDGIIGKIIEIRLACNIIKICTEDVGVNPPILELDLSWLNNILIYRDITKILKQNESKKESSYIFNYGLKR